MNWRQMSHAKRKSIVSELCNKGMNQQEVADELLCNVSTVKRFCRDYDIGIWPRGGQRGNTNAMITGASHQSIRKKTQEIVIKVGKNLRVCERCNDYNKWQNWSIHHKDEDRSNNDISNLEILCNTCHALEHIQRRERDILGRVL